jgi:hypothetical protein
MQESTFDEIAIEAQKVLFFNRDAKYIILSVEAYQHLRARHDAVINFNYDNDGLVKFMGRDVAITDKRGIHVGWGK